ncbi:putative swollenin [Penicillium oxalicum 114-2]|uniref:Putative swollenin n=1 Tax=Penicillium oxalicum (strain 114-2 / CGMCC 5302) TaxID=933388 RepID=S7ZAB6_PENO1|nr:putative swollenin [Penicillium oxalicum 114-2]
MAQLSFLTLAVLGLSGTVAAQSACASAWAQCGGSNFNGPTCCVSGSSCSVLNPYYSQCVPGTQVPGSGSGSSSTRSSSTTTAGGTGPSTTATAGGGAAGTSKYTTSTSFPAATATQPAYPSADPSSCGAWTLVDNVCCPEYCLSNNKSESCTSSCSGGCGTPPSSMCKSGTMWGEQLEVGTDEDWHYSRSTHFGLTSGGACGFGLYGLCTKGSKTASWTDPMLGSTCDAFCTAYPLLCKDPSDVTLRGNFAAPNGDYYTQFWPSLIGALPGSPDNYLSCGECFELIRTRADGTEYQVGDSGYTDPIYLEVVDSCPCSANSKWCCGSGADHCGEIDFKYGCPLPEGSHHMDLSDIAMGRLQGNGSLTDGVIPIRYRRVPCPKPGNAYVWLRDGGSEYYFALSVVNTNGVGSITTVEVKGKGSNSWVALKRDPNYTSSRPQERYGAWVVPQGKGPFSLPVGIRVTSPDGQQIVNENAITSFTAPAGSVEGFYYIDLGVQFT